MNLSWERGGISDERGFVLSRILIKWVWVESVWTLWAGAPTWHVWHMLNVKSRMMVIVESVVFLLVYTNLPSTNKDKSSSKVGFSEKSNTHIVCFNIFSLDSTHFDRSTPNKHCMGPSLF